MGQSTLLIVNTTSASLTLTQKSGTPLTIKAIDVVPQLAPLTTPRTPLSLSTVTDLDTLSAGMPEKAQALLRCPISPRIRLPSLRLPPLHRALSVEGRTPGSLLDPFLPWAPILDGPKPMLPSTSSAPLALGKLGAI